MIKILDVVPNGMHVFRWNHGVRKEQFKDCNLVRKKKSIIRIRKVFLGTAPDVGFCEDGAAQLH